MWQNTLNDDVIKFFVNLGTQLVKLIDNIGLINTLVFGLMGYLTVFKKDKLDLASLLGVHDVDKGWTLGKEGLTGWIANKRKKTNNKIDSSNIFTSTEGEQLDLFSEEMQTQAKLNDKIKQLNKAKEELKSLQKTKFKDIQIPDDAIKYKARNGRKHYLNEVLIPNKQAEITAIEKDIDDITRVAETKIQQSKIKLSESDNGQMMFDFDATSEQAKTASTKFLDIFENGLGKGATDPLSVDFDKLSGMLKELDGMDGSQLRQYMTDLGSLGDEAGDTEIALAGYVSTVEDGNYSIQGAQRYVKQYNQGLAQMSKQAMKAQITQNLLNLAISAVAMAASALIMWAINKISEAQDEFEELSSELSSITSELKNLESEFDNINNQIKELQDLGTLSFSEQEELERLQEESAELERQIDLQKTLQKQKQLKMNQDAPKAAENYYKKTGVKSSKTTGELAGQGAMIGVGIGGAIAAAVVGGIIAASGPIGWAIAAGIGIAAGGATIGAGIGAGIGATEEKVGDSIDNMQSKYAELQQKYADAQAKYEETLKDKDYEKAQKAQEQLTEFEGNMAQHLSELNEYYGQMDWETATTEQRAAMQEFYDTQDKWAITSGGQDAKVNAIDRIFGKNADKEIQKVGKELRRMAEEGEDIDLEKALDTSGLNKADIESFSARLHEMGIYVYEVEDAFKQATESAQDLANTDIYDASKDVGATSKGLSTITSVFDELNEKGYVTSETIDTLKETLGDVDQLGDAWTNYQNIMSSATASTEEMKDATEELVKAYLDSQINFAEGPITNDQSEVYIKQLKDMGVKNAEEYIANRIQEGMYTKIQLSAEFNEDEIKSKFEKLKNDKTFQEKIGIKADVDWDTDVSNEQKKAIAEYVDEVSDASALVKQISADNAKEIAQEYGYAFDEDTLTDIIYLVNERYKAETKVTEEKKKQAEYEEYVRAKKTVGNNEDYGKVKIDGKAWNDSSSYETDLWTGNRTYGDGTVITSTDVANIQQYEQIIETLKNAMSDLKYQTDGVFDVSKYEDRFSGQLQDIREFEDQYSSTLLVGQSRIDDYISAIQTLMSLQNQAQANGWIDDAGNLTEGVPEQIKKDLDEAQAVVDGFENDIKNKFTDPISIDFDVTGLGAAGAAFDSYTSKMEALASIQSELANGFTISAAKAREFAAVYPEILANAQPAANGQIQLNADVAKNFVNNKRAELDAELDTEIAELEGQKAVLEGKKASAESQLKMAKALAEGEAGVTKEQLEWQVNAENIATQAFVEMKIDETNAQRLACAAMAGNEEEFDRIVAEVTANMDSNMAAATTSAAKNVYDAMNSGSTNVIGFANNCSKAIEEFNKIGQDGASPSYPSKNDIGGVSGGSHGATIKQYNGSFNGAEFSYTTKEINLDDLISSIELDIQGYNEGINQINGQIALLESLKNMPVKEFGSDKGSGGGSGGNGGGGGGSGDGGSGKDDSGDDKDDDKPTAKEVFDTIAAEYDRKIANLETEKELIQSEIDKAESRGEVASEAFYQRQIELENQNKQALIDKKAALEDYLKAQGKNMTKEEWADAYKEIQNCSTGIKDCENNILDLGQAIDDIHWEYFDKFTSEVDDLGDEMSTLLDLIGDVNDAVDENGNWTASGIAQIGLNTQEMERNLQMVDAVQKEMGNVQNSWNAYQNLLKKHGGNPDAITEKEKKAIQDKYGVLITSESEYQEEMQRLSKTQRGYAKAAKDSKDAIEELAKARVQKDIDAIEEQIDAYNELISLKKKELDAERDLYEFKNNIKDQTKDIASLERRIASLSGSTDAADVAELRKLQGQLSEAQSGLDDTYYSHAKDAQQNALDEEAEAYEKSQRDKIKILEDTLENADALIAQAIMDSLLNADIALDTIKNTATQYNLEVSPELTAPWEAASIEAGNYKKWLQDNIPNGVLAGVTDENGVITLFSKNLDKKINGPWSKAKTAVKNYVTYMGSKTVKNLPSMFTIWQSKIQGIANKWNNVKKAAKEAAQEQINAANVKVPKNQGKSGGRSGGSGGRPGGSGGRPGGSGRRPGGRPSGGKTSPKKYTGMVEAGVTWNNKYYTTIARTKQKYDTKQKAISAAVEVAHSQLLQKLSGAFPNSAEANRVYQQQIRKKVAIRRSTAYAKGTLGTKKDEWAIDSEPQHGDELVLVPGKGVLSYMRKGTSVVPAKLTENLMEWGKLSPNEQGSSENVNITNNYISGSEAKVDLGTSELSQGNISETAKNNSRNTEDVNKSVEDSNQSIKDTTDDTNKHIEKSVNDTANNTISELNLVLDSTKDIDQNIVKDTSDTLDSVLNSTKNTNKDVIKNSNDTLSSVLDSTKDTNQDTIDDSGNTLKSILGLTNSYKPSITTNLTSPWINASKKSEDFKSKSNTYYRQVMSYVGQNKGTLESYLKTPYVNLTGKKDKNAVYKYSNYAKKASITDIITYAKSKSKSVTSSLSKGYNDARQSISNFSSAGCASVDRLKSKFTDSKNGLIKALKDTKQAAELAKKAIESVPSYGGSGGIGGLVVPSGGLSSPYGYRTDPKTGKVKFHGGNDYGAPYGARINAARNGIVSTVGWMPRGYGKYVILDHGNGIQTLYGHTSAILVKEGQRVTIGQQIAKVGSTGYSTGPHVHFEYRRNGKRLNPATLPMFAKGTLGTKKDQWAVTDEIGDELVMVPTAQGNISYMRKGTSVMPADISENLVEWGQLNPNMMNMPSATQGINLMSNYINKPELKIDVENLLRCDNVSEDTLPELKKFVTQELDNFARKLNYSLKRFSK